MDRAMLEQHLVLAAEQHVTSGERIVARQKIPIAQMLRGRLDTREATSLLTLFEEVLRIFLSDRDRLRAKLAQ